MDDRLFTDPSGELMPLIGGGKAFVPRALPPQLDLARLMTPVGKALAAIGELKGAARRLPNPWLLIQPVQRQEALATSAMEGTYTTLEELVMEEATPGAGRNDTREVANFIRALHHAERSMDEGRPIAHRLLCEAHAILLRGVERQRGAHRLPGEYKRDQNYIGGVGEAARFVPPPPRMTAELMAALERFVNAAEQRDPARAIIDIALVHYQFEAIHPFADGNGRMGRMLVTLLAKKWGLLDDMLLYVSPELEGRRERYVELMFDVSARSGWEAWIAFMADVMAASCRRVIGIIDELLELRADYKRRAREAGRSTQLHKLVELLFSRPVITVPKAKELLGVKTYRGAQQILGKLEKAGILSPLPDTRPRAWIARGILDIIRQR